MPRKQGNRVLVTLACAECHARTYTTEKNRRNDTQRLELTKFCPHCRSQRMHREVR